MKIASFPDTNNEKPASAYAEEVFRDFLSLAADLKRAFKPFTAQPMQLKCFDGNTTVQFQDSDSVRELREGLEGFHSVFQATVEKVKQGRTGVESLLDDENKSKGPRFFGSIARSAHPCNAKQLRWTVDLPILPPLTFHHVYFLVSDDGLTNFHTSANALKLHV